MNSSHYLRVDLAEMINFKVQIHLYDAGGKALKRRQITGILTHIVALTKLVVTPGNSNTIHSLGHIK